MVKFVFTKSLLATACLTTLAIACTPTESTVSEPTIEAAETALVLPDGTECLHAGRGATLAFEGKRLNYTCGDNLGLIGDMAIANGTDLTLDIATIEGTTITESQTLALTISTVELTDGTTCLNAGQGATLAFDGKRLNYTCDAPTAELGLIGDIAQNDGVFSAELATLDGTSLISTETVDISTLITVEP